MTITQSKPSYTTVKCHYEKLREQSRQVTHENLRNVLMNKWGQPIAKHDIELKSIDHRCMVELLRYEACQRRRVDWDWIGKEGVLTTYKSKPKRFELAVWHRNHTLCAAGIGKPTSSGNKLRLDYIEADPDGSLLEGLVMDICLGALTVYARYIGAHQIRIMRPVNERVRNYYLSKPGFTFERNGNYCVKAI